MPRKGKGTRKPEIRKLVDHMVTAHNGRAYAASSMVGLVKSDHIYYHSAENPDLRHQQHPAGQLRPPKDVWVANLPSAQELNARARMGALDALLDFDREEDTDYSDSPED